MGIAEAYKSAFEARMGIMGQTIVIHEKFNTSESTYYEIKGIKKTNGKNSRQIIFQFPEALDIPVGAVLQVKGGRDYWRVTDTEDIFQEDTFINFEAQVEKIDLAGQPTRPALKGTNTFNLHGPNPRVNIQSQDSSVNISNQVSENTFADMRQVIQAQIQNEEERIQILTKLSELEHAKGTSSFLQKYQDFIALAANHMSVLAPFIPALTQMLGG